jgi:hypothetical protein
MTQLGQINMTSQFGREIYKICQQPDVNVCVDIGAWNGHGSTRCIVQALESKKSGHVYSFEVDDKMFEEASRVWDGNSYVTLAKNRLCTSMMTLEQVIAHPNYSNISGADWRKWYDGEEKNFNSSTVGTLPDKIDFVIIDGGEFSGEGDWAAIKDKNPKYVALDDIFTVKTSRVRDELLSSNEWSVHSEGSDRNGWVILVNTLSLLDDSRVTHSSETPSG